jgi:hypothetical protein
VFRGPSVHLYVGTAIRLPVCEVVVVFGCVLPRGAFFESCPFLRVAGHKRDACATDGVDHASRLICEIERGSALPQARRLCYGVFARPKLFGGDFSKRASLSLPGHA